MAFGKKQMSLSGRINSKLAPMSDSCTGKLLALHRNGEDAFEIGDRAIAT